MILSVENGSFSYRKTKILDDVNFQISSGEIMSILGPNGIGKTTLVKCMLGILAWEKGKTVIDGLDIKDLNEKEIGKKIGYVPQAKIGTIALTGIEMVLLGRSAHLKMMEQPGEKDYKIAEEAMKTIGVYHLRDKHCNRISGGELQMILIARALASESPMLVLDEPESNLDFRNQLIILETLRMLVKERNLCAVINTHSPANALKISDKALLICRCGNKKVCKYGGAKDIINESNMKEAFQVQVCVKEIDFKGKIISTVVPVEKLN